MSVWHSVEAGPLPLSPALCPSREDAGSRLFPEGVNGPAEGHTANALWVSTRSCSGPGRLPAAQAFLPGRGGGGGAVLAAVSRLPHFTWDLVRPADPQAPPPRCPRDACGHRHLGGAGEPACDMHPTQQRGVLGASPARACTPACPSASLAATESCPGQPGATGGRGEGEAEGQGLGMAGHSRPPPAPDCHAGPWTFLCSC